MLCKLSRAKALVQSTGNLGAGIDLARGFEFAETLVKGGYNLGEVLVQAESANLLEEGAQGSGRNCGTESLNKGSIFLERRVERAADLKKIGFAGPCSFVCRAQFAYTRVSFETALGSGDWQKRTDASLRGPFQTAA